MKELLQLFKTTGIEWNRREAPRMGASLAFYSLLSMAPLLVVVVTICAISFGAARAQTQLLEQFRQMVGDDAARTIETVLQSAQRPAAGILANLVGLLTLVLGATGVLIELRAALNHLWGIEPPPTASGLMGLVRERIFSFGMVLGMGFLLLVSLSISAGLALAGKFFGRFGWVPPTFWELINFVVSVAVITAMFSLIFRYLPDEKLPWESIWRGGAITALLFTAGKTAIGIYLGKAGVGSAYGAAGSLVVLIVWIYYSAQIFYFGAIFTHVYACKRYPEELPECVLAATETVSYKAG
jgi:membrane protein